jgi:hypothetical protein
MTSNEQSWRKLCKRSSNFAWKLSADCQEHSRASEYRPKNQKILTEDHDMRKVDVHHDNVPGHTALSVREFLVSKQITVLEHPPYSLDLAPVTSTCSQI